MQLFLIILDSLSSCLMLNSSSLWHEPPFYSTFEQCLEQQSLSLCLQTLGIMEQLIYFLSLLHILFPIPSAVTWKLLHF